MKNFFENKPLLKSKIAVVLIISLLFNIIFSANILANIKELSASTEHTENYQSIKNYTVNEDEENINKEEENITEEEENITEDIKEIEEDNNTIESLGDDEISEAENIETETNESIIDELENDEETTTENNIEPIQQETKNEEFENEEFEIDETKQTENITNVDIIDTSNEETNNNAETTIESETNTEQKDYIEISTESDIVILDKENEVNEEIEKKNEYINISTSSNFENVIMSTESEISFFTFASASETISTIISTYSSLLDTYNQLNEYGDISINDRTITLYSNLNLEKEIIINESLTIDLNGYNIENLSDVDNKNNFTLFNIKSASESFITVDFISSNYEKVEIFTYDICKNNTKNIIRSHSKTMPCINIENANVNFSNIYIYASKNNSALNIKNADVKVDGACIFGGDGVDYENPNGAVAIDIYFDDENRTFTFINGIIKGGTGAKDNKDYLAKGGSPLASGYFSTTNHYTTNGNGGTFGCGFGGDAIRINAVKYIKNIIVKNFGICGGDAGIDENKENVLLGADEEYPRYYDLRNPITFSTDDKKYDKGVVSDLKDQKTTELCQIFANVASAETHMMKKYPEYLSEYFADDEDYKRDGIATFSEAHFGYYLYDHPKDPLLNANYPHYTVPYNRSYQYTPTYVDQIKMAISRTGVAANSKVHFDENFNAVPSLNSTSSVAYDYVAKYKSMSYDNLKQDKATNVKNIKKLIYEHDGAVILMQAPYYIQENDMSIKDTDTEDVKNAKKWYAEKYSTWSNAKTYFITSRNVLSGHAMFIVGWDDDFDKNLFPERYRPSSNGAFIIKNSWGCWTFLSYEFDLANGAYWREAYGIDWVPEYKMQNIYYYDGSDSRWWFSFENPTNIAHKWTVKKDKEHLKAVTLPNNGTNSYDTTVKIYKTKTKDIDNLADEDLIAEKTSSIKPGYNYIDFSDENIELEKNDIIYTILNIPSYAENDIDASTTTNYTTVTADSNNSYMKREGVDANYIHPVNFDEGIIKNWRIKMITTDYFNLTFNNDKDCDAFQNVKVDYKEKYVFPSDIVLDDGTYIKHFEIDGEKFYAGDKISITENKNINIVWTNPKNINYNSNGGNGYMETSVTEKGERFKIPTSSFIKKGYTFSGWSTNQSSTTVEYNDEGTIDVVGGDTTLYAVWSPIIYNISFDGNGASGGTAPNNIFASYDKEYSLPKNTFTKNNYKFNGWATIPNASNVEILAEGTKIKNLSDTANTNIKFYAIWKEMPANTISSGGNGGNSNDNYNGANLVPDVNRSIAKNLNVDYKTLTGNWHYNPIYSQWSFVANNINDSTTNSINTNIIPNANNQNTATQITNSNSNISSNGTLMEGWYLIADKLNNKNWYYFKAGIMQAGFIETNGSIYYLEINSLDLTYGAMKKGWQNIMGKVYYFDEEGKLANSF